MILRKVLNNKYSKTYSSNCKADFKAIKYQCSKYSSIVSDMTTEHEVGGDDFCTESMDNDEDSSDSEGDDKPAAKDFLDTILTAARPRSFNGR